MISNIFGQRFLNGLERMTEESSNFDKIVRGVYGITAIEIYGSPETPGIAAFSYGSPGRIELVGGDSDADILIIEDKITEKSKRFRDLLKQRLGVFDFSKVDLPDWGSYADIETYLDKSLIEGNQILETRFLIGDGGIRQYLELKKKKYNSVERSLRNIVFNRLYLNQYFRQRVRNGALNIKYCPGGSRDFLFVYWYDKLDRMIKGDKDDISYQPRIKIGLQRLYNSGKINEEEFLKAVNAVNFLTVLRSDVLILNKNTSDKGLTFLDLNTAERLQLLGYPSPNETLMAFRDSREVIEDVSGIVFNEAIKKAESFRGIGWERQFILANSADTPEIVRKEISSDDPLMRIATIWGASESDQRELFCKLSEAYKNTDDWTTIGSIVCSPLCSSEILHHFGTGQAKEKGYGYLLRVIARNKNVKIETLESIANDSSLEKRYTEVAQAALKGGKGAANNQI